MTPGRGDSGGLLGTWGGDLPEESLALTPAKSIEQSLGLHICPAQALPLPTQPTAGAEGDAHSSGGAGVRGGRWRRTIVGATLLPGAAQSPARLPWLPPPPRPRPPPRAWPSKPTPLSAPFSEGHLVSTEFGVSQTWVQAWAGFRRDCGDYSSLIRLPCKHGNSE